MKFVKHTIKNALITTMLVILLCCRERLMPVATGLPSPATLLFNTPKRAIQSQQDKTLKGNDTYKTHFSLICHRVYSSCAKRRWWTVNTWVIVQGDSTEHKGLSYIVRVTRTGRVITDHNRYVRH